MFARLRKYIARRNIAMRPEGRVKSVPIEGYLLIAYPHDYGWVALMPDFRGAMGRARKIEQAVNEAILGAQKVSTAMADLGKPRPTPLDLATVRDNPVWTLAYGINWNRAIVQTVPAGELVPTKTKANVFVRRSTVIG